MFTCSSRGGPCKLALGLVLSVGAFGCDAASTGSEIESTAASDGPARQTEGPGPTQTPSAPTAVAPQEPTETEKPTDTTTPEVAPRTTVTDLEDAAAPPTPPTDAGAAMPLEAGSELVFVGVWPPARSAEDAGSEAASAFTHQQTCVEQSECGLVSVTMSEAGVTYDADAARCILTAMVGGFTGSYGHRLVERTGESVDTYFLTHPFGLAQVSTRQAPEASDAGGDSFAEYLCTFAPTEFLNECLAELPEGKVTVPTLPRCANPAFWFSGCAETPVPDTQCPNRP
jgi:hypothetical protein